MEDTVLFFWLVIAVLFLILELSSPGLFYFLSFFFGAVCGAISSYFSDAVLVQGLAFIGGTMCALMLLRWWLKKKQAIAHHQKTNVDALHGKRGIVIKQITPDNSGQVTVGSEIWSARSAHNVSIEVGAQVEVLRISGSHVIVIEVKR
jgi:membrane protein implicated in regulation of membrane protease activity